MSLSMLSPASPLLLSPKKWFDIIIAKFIKICVCNYCATQKPELAGVLPPNVPAFWPSVPFLLQLVDKSFLASHFWFLSRLEKYKLIVSVDSSVCELAFLCVSLKSTFIYSLRPPPPCGPSLPVAHYVHYTPTAVESIQQWHVSVYLSTNDFACRMKATLISVKQFIFYN